MIVGVIEPHKQLRELLTWALEHKGHSVRQYEELSEGDAQELNVLVIEPGPPEQKHPALQLVKPWQLVIQSEYESYIFSDHVIKGAIALIKPYSTIHMMEMIERIQIRSAQRGRS